MNSVIDIENELTFGLEQIKKLQTWEKNVWTVFKLCKAK